MLMIKNALSLYKVKKTCKGRFLSSVNINESKNLPKRLKNIVGI